MCGAKRSVNGRVGNLISEVLRAVIEGEETDECISTEEMLHHMEVAAKEIAGQAPSSMSDAHIYSGGFWDSKACAVCAR